MSGIPNTPLKQQICSSYNQQTCTCWAMWQAGNPLLNANTDRGRGERASLTVAKEKEPLSPFYIFFKQVCQYFSSLEVKAFVNLNLC